MIESVGIDQRIKVLKKERTARKLAVHTVRRHAPHRTPGLLRIEPSPLDASSSLKRTEKRDQVGFLLLGKTQAETPVVEIHYVLQACRRAVVKIRCARSQAAQNRSLGLADVGTFARDHGSSRIGDAEYFAGRPADKGIDRQAAGIERSQRREVSDANVQRHGKRVVAGVGRVVASSAKAHDDLLIQGVIDSGYSGNRNHQRIEELLPSGNGFSRFFVRSGLRETGPIVEDSKGIGIER